MGKKSQIITLPNWRLRFFYIISIGYIVSQLFPPLAALLPFGLSLYLFAYVLLALVFVPTLLLNKSIIWITLFYIIIFFKFLSGNAYVPRINEVIIPYLNILAPFLFSSFTLKYIDERKCKILITISAILLVIFCLTSIRALINNPLLMRQIYSGTESMKHPLLYGYADVHQMVVLLLPMCFFIKNAKGLKSSRWICLAMLAMFLVLMAVSNAGTALVVGILCVFIGVITRQDKVSPKKVFSFSLVFLLLYVLNETGVIVYLLELLRGVLPGGGTTADRIEEIEFFLQYGSATGDLAGRQDLYSDSWSLFLKSPFFGTDSPELIGHHAYIIDMLACLGLFLIIPFFVFMYTTIKATYQKLSISKVTYLLGAMSYLIILFTKNQFGFFYLLGLLPLFCKYIDYSIER